jgi:hypothetical protein
MKDGLLPIAGEKSGLEKGNKPVSVNSWLTGIRAYLMWLHNKGVLGDEL